MKSEAYTHPAIFFTGLFAGAGLFALLFFLHIYNLLEAIVDALHKITQGM